VTSRAALVDPVDELLAQPGDHSRTTAVVHGQEQVDEPHRRQATEEARLLEQPSVRPSTGCRQRRRDPGRAGPHDQHVWSTNHG